MRRTVLAVVVVLVAAALAWAEGPDPATPSVEALGQTLPTRAYYGGCAMSEEAQALLGNAAPPGFEAGPRSTEGRICEIEIPACYYYEGEGDCYDEYIDDFNGGCNHPSEPFSVLPESYGQPLVVWGTAGTYLVGASNYRDTDWYEIVLDQPTFITMGCIAEFPVVFGFLDGTSGCPVVSFLDYRAPDECIEDSLTMELGPGTFWLFVAPNAFSGIPCGSDYVMTVEGYRPPPCVLECPGGSVIEGEPVCGLDYEDFYNGGCNFDPQTFQDLDPSGGMIVVCGETGVYDNQGLCYRDLDWYRITPAEPTEIQFCAAAEFDIVIFLLEPGPDPMNPCNAFPTLDFQQEPACVAACINAVLDPGEYWLVVSTVSWMPLDCGSEYTMTLTGYTTPVEQVSWGTIKALYR
jgi:hypothetical protein